METVSFGVLIHSGPVTKKLLKGMADFSPVCHWEEMNLGKRMSGFNNPLVEKICQKVLILGKKEIGQFLHVNLTHEDIVQLRCKLIYFCENRHMNMRVSYSGDTLRIQRIR